MQQQGIIQQVFGQKAFEEVFRNEYKPLCFYAIKFVKDLDTARELVQESFLQLWEKRETIEPEKSVRSYLYTSVHNRCLNHLRNNSKFSADLLEAESHNVTSVAETHHRIETGELQARINAAIDKMPEKCREIFVLNRFENLKYNDIAQKLSISVKTVEGQMSKALQIMRTHLADYLSLLLLIFLKFFN